MDSLSQSVRERGSSVTGAYEGWYYGKDGNTYALVGYFNRNTKQEFDIPVGPNNRIEPGGPDQAGAGGGGFQCCWTTAHVAVAVKAGT
ncbi:MAG: hypothetical protein AUH72_07435 [Acidobacteria bacterium 13_1_40CM_4_65_8]|nr:MAG: hypothetical protein AUH72_07435 [Acidobacteria bacterium 13_1_40CM_4_65_8]